MNTLDDLRQTLEAHVGLAPDGAGIVQQAQAGAGRLRRRRAVLRAGVAAVAVVAAVAAAPTVSLLRDGGVPMGAAAPANRTPAQFTLAVTPEAPFTVTATDSVDTRQSMMVSPTAPAAGSSTSARLVVAHDAGSFDPAALLGGERVTVSGHDGWFVASGSRPASRPNDSDGKPGLAYLPPRLGWQTSQGAWLVVSPVFPEAPTGSAAADRERDLGALLPVAQAVRLTAPRDTRVPYRLGWLPAGLRVHSVRVGLPDRQPAVKWSLPGSGESVGTSGGKVEEFKRDRLDITTSLLGGKPIEGLTGRPTTTIAGHPVWHLPGKPSTLIVKAGNCVVTLAGWGTLGGLADLKRIVESMTVADCARTDTWSTVGP